MNKEIDLTRIAQNPYPKGGDIFMPGEPGGGEFSSIQQASRLDTPAITVERPQNEGGAFSKKAGGLTPERINKAREEWEKFNETRKIRGEKISPDELSSQRITWESGIPPMGGGAAGEIIDSSAITDPKMIDLVGQINEYLTGARVSEETLRNAYNLVFNRTVPRAKEAIKREILKRINDATSDFMTVEEARQAARQRVVEAEQEERERTGIFGNRQLSKEEKELIRNARNPDELEKLFNRMFAKVDSSPYQEFSEVFSSAGSYEYEEFRRVINDEIARLKDEDPGSTAIPALTKIVDQFTQEKAARERIHNAYYGVLAGQNTEGMSKFIDGFLSGWEDMAVRKAGVSSAMHFYEQALLIAKEERGGYLKSTDVVGEMSTKSDGKVNIMAKKFLEAASASGQIKNENGEPLEPWQIDRALAFARGLLIINGRTIEIAATSILLPGAASFTDQYAQRIIAELAPFRHQDKFISTSQYSHLLAYVINRGDKPWSPKELEEFHSMSLKQKINIINGLTKEGETDDITERFFSILNPLEIGGFLSRTGWRFSTDSPYSLLNDLISNGRGGWVGTGVEMERLRGSLVKGEQEAYEKTREQLDLIAQRTPLRLLLSIKNVQDKVLGGWQVNGSPASIELLENSISELVLLQEALLQESVSNPTVSMNDEFLGRHGASEQTVELIGRIRTVWRGGERDRFLNVLKDKDWKTPYTFGTDDAPYDEYKFEDTGNRSVARRWGDMASAAKAATALSEFMGKIESFKDPAQIIEAMKPIYDGIKGYNEDDAKKFVLKLSEGVMKFYGKSWTHRLPLGIGTLLSTVAGRASYAQIAYGKGAMAWDEFQSNEFTRLMRDSGMLTEDQQHELQSRAGGGKKEVSWAYLRTLLPLLSLYAIWYLMNKVGNDK